MQEYWINVYRYPFSLTEQFIGGSYTNKDDANDMAIVTGYCLYRIHVKLKPKLPTQADIIQKSNEFILNRIKYKPKEPHESWKSF